jgi:hypothetical protein
MLAMPSDLFANASLFTPPEPESRDKLDISDMVIAGLIMRLIYMNSRMVAHEIAAEICLPFYNIVEPILNELKDSRLIEITHGEMASVSYTYAITDAGRARALQYFEQTTYVGPAPISVEAYNQIIAEQSLRQITVHADRLHEAFRGLVFDDKILDQVGPAVNSGRSIFLYGPPGNGKTSICERIVKSFGGSIFIPFALEVKGSIIRVFDEYNHKQIMPGSDMRLQGKYDRRFRLIERPVIIVGGELNMDSLDLIWNEESRFYEAPIQMKANGGALMIDDFGRQRIDPKTLLNRWIVPLEKQIDFLNPRDLVDDAFLRRIRYKIPINDPTHENYRAIWRIVSENRSVPYADEIVDYFVEKHMRTFGRPLRGCQPRDIIDNILDVCRYRQIEPTVTAEMLDDAADAYFVKFDDKNYSSIK